MSRHFALSVIAVALACQLYSTIAADDSKPSAAAQVSDESPSSESTKSSGEKHLLRYRFRPDEVVRSKVIQQTKIETTIGGTTQAAEMSSISIKAWRVTDVNASGHITFDTMIEAVDMRQQMSGRQEVRYNSQTDDKAPPGYESAAASVGKLLTTITIDPAGKLIRREKKHQIGVDNLNAQVVVPLPPEPIAVGEPWSAPADVMVSLDGGDTKTLTLKNRYQLEKVENGIATISVQTILPPINDPKIRAQLIQRMTKGTVRFDIKAGRVTSQQTDLDEQVIGFSGPGSNLQYIGRFSEELITGDAQASAKKTTKR
jgi:hypothetical protein